MKIKQILEAKYGVGTGKNVRSITFFTAVDDMWNLDPIRDGIPDMPLYDEYAITPDNPHTWLEQAYEDEFKHYKATPEEKQEFKEAAETFLELTEGRQGIYLSFGFEYDHQLVFIEGKPKAIAKAMWNQWLEKQENRGDEINEKESQRFRDFIDRLVR